MFKCENIRYFHKSLLAKSNGFIVLPFVYEHVITVTHLYRAMIKIILSDNKDYSSTITYPGHCCAISISHIKNNERVRKHFLSELFF